jgi:hypothetical protein
VLTDLNAAAPEINTFIKQLGPFSQAGTPALTSLGDAAVVGDQALIKAKPIAQDLGTFATQARPTVHNLEGLLTSLKDTGGIERLMDFLYFSAASTNGYDSLGHYLRAVFVLTTCTTYSIAPTPNCSANFPKNANATASARAAKASTTKPTVASVNQEIAAGRSPYLARQDAVAKGLDPAVFANDSSSGSSSSSQGTGKKGSAKGGTAKAKIDLPANLFPGQPASSAPAAPAAQGSGAAAPTATTPGSPGTTTSSTTVPQGTSATDPASSAATSATPAGSPSSGASQTLLDYLLGG